MTECTKSRMYEITMRKSWIRGFVISWFLLTAIPLTALAEPTCLPTPKLATINYPGVHRIPTTNHLLKPTGKSIEAEGQRVILMGRLFDKNCMPVPNAIIELWQVDPYGKWILAMPEDIATPNPVFAGAGRTYTDNEGNFSFITAFPAETRTYVRDEHGKIIRTIIHAPNFNLRINAEDMPAFSTRLYFTGDNRNSQDPLLKKLSIEARQRVMLDMQPLSATPTDGHFGVIDIVLPSVVPYLEY